MYLLISFIIIVMSYLLFRTAAGTLNPLKINMISYIFYHHLIIESFIGVNIAILYLDDHYLISQLTSIELRQLTYFAVCYVMVAMPISMVALNKLLRFNPKKALASYHEYLRNAINEDKGLIPLMVFSMISLISVIYTYWSLKDIPIFIFMAGLADEASIARAAASRGFEGIEYIRNIFGLGMTPILCYSAYCYKRQSSKYLYKVIFNVLFVLSVVILFYDTQKGPILTFLIGFLFLKVLYDGQISRKFFSSILLCVFAMIFGMYVVLGEFDNVISINQGPLGRIFQSQIAGLFYHFDIFPDQREFLWGASFPPLLLSLFNVEHIRSARAVMEIVNPAGVAAGMAGVINTLFIGEAWANFGWIGFIFSPIIVGTVIQFSFIAFLKYLPKHPFFIAFYAYLSLSWPVTGGFVDFIYSPLLLILFILVCIMYKWAKPSSIHTSSERKSNAL